MKWDTRNRKLLPVTWHIARTHFKITINVRTLPKNKNPLLTWHVQWKYPPEHATFKIPMQSLFCVLGTSCYKSLQHSGSPEKIWPGIGSSDCTPGSLTRPAQLSRCMSGCVARCSTATVGQPECGQRDLAWVSLVRGHGTTRLPVVSAHCRSLRQLSLLANLHVSDKSNYRDCTQEEEKLYSPSQSCCFLVLLYPPLGHSSIFHPLTCKKTPSK